MRNRISQNNLPSPGHDVAVTEGLSSHRSRRISLPRQIERSLAPIRTFIDEQMVDNILVVLRVELARVDAGREPRSDEIAQFLREIEPADLLRLIRTHPTMRGLESLTSSDHRVLRWCEMLSRAL